MASKKDAGAEEGDQTTGAGPKTQITELITLSPEDTGEADKPTIQSVRRSIDAFEGKGGTSPNITFTKSVSSPSASPKVADEAKRIYQSALAQLDASGNIKSTIKVSVKSILKRLYNMVVQLEKEPEKKKGKTTRKDETAKPKETRNGKEEEEEEPQQKVTNKDLMDEIKAVRDLVRGNARQEKVEEISREIRSEVKEVKELIKDSTEQTGRGTYAEVTSGPARRALHTLVVSSEEAGDSSHDIIGKIRAAVDARTTGIRVDRVRRGKDQKVIIGCEKREEMERVRERLERPEIKLNTEKKANKDPLVVFKDVMEDADDKILQAIKIQNRHVFEDIPDEEIRMQIRYKKKTRNPLQSHVVMSVSPRVWINLTREGFAHVDLQRVRVLDQSPLVQCTRCLKFGHGKRLCTETADLCSHCGEPHMRSECPAYKAYVPPSCHNCVLAKNDKAHHNAFDVTCPVRVRWDELARSSVAYC